MDTVEYRLMHWITSRFNVATADWPNRSHPPRHRFWMRLTWPWSRGMCWFCGLRVARRPLARLVPR